MEILNKTQLPELEAPKKGKVRDIYDCGDHLIFVTTDRISVFDLLFDKGIPDKGRILNDITHFWFEKIDDITAHHFVDQPDPKILVVKKCQPILIEVIVRGYIVGSLWRDYKAGKREKCGVALPEGLQENDPLPEPIITPSTKANEGNDVDISTKEIIASKLVTKEIWQQMASTSLALFKRGQMMLKERGLILVDTKYEFGFDSEKKLTLIDEVHTPDSSRFWYTKDKKPAFSDKEFVREWVMKQNGYAGGPLPPLTEEMQEKVRNNYIGLHKTITGKDFQELEPDSPEKFKNILQSSIAEHCSKRS